MVKIGDNEFREVLVNDDKDYYVFYVYNTCINIFFCYTFSTHEYSSTMLLWTGFDINPNSMKDVKNIRNNIDLHYISKEYLYSNDAVIFNVYFSNILILKYNEICINILTEKRIKKISQLLVD